MLEHTFCHIPGIGSRTECFLWSAGWHTWTDVTRRPDLPISREKRAALQFHIRESTAQLRAGNAEYFYGLLPTDQYWRLFPAFRDQVAYFDIETTGLGGPDDYITTIALYDGRELRTYVQGRNLGDFVRDIAAYRLLVTYNGKAFDAPFVRRYLGIPLDQPHIDLRYVLEKLGYRGGLKSCERQLGLSRQGLEEVDGFFAVLLWRDYLRGNANALSTLLAYNALDAINLETLMVVAYNLQIAKLPLERISGLPLPTPQALPFAVDQLTVRRLKAALGKGWLGRG